MSFRSDNSGFFAGADKVGTFLFSNFIWVVLSLTIIGIPFGTVGLLAMMNALVQDRQPEFFRVFIGAIRTHWRKAIVFGLLNVAVGGVLYINLLIFQFMGYENVMAVLSRTMTVFVAVVLLSANMYVWSMISLLDLSIKNLLKLTLILVLTYPMRSLALMILTISPMVLGLFLPVAFGIFVLIAVSAYISSRSTWYMLRHHFPREDLDQLMFSATD